MPLLEELLRRWTGPGNINLFSQPIVKNPDGTTSTVDSSSYGMDGQEVLLPSVTGDGRHLSADSDIIAEYRKTGRHLGKFKDPQEATNYATQLHNDYEAGNYTPPLATSRQDVDSSRLEQVLQFLLSRKR